jgi:hypothetical protein
LQHQYQYQDTDARHKAKAAGSRQQAANPNPNPNPKQDTFLLNNVKFETETRLKPGRGSYNPLGWLWLDARGVFCSCGCSLNVNEKYRT